jgi:hypothetical protein
MNIGSNRQRSLRLCPANFRDLFHVRTLLCNDDGVTSGNYSYVLIQETTVCL